MPRQCVCVFTNSSAVFTAAFVTRWRSCGSDHCKGVVREASNTGPGGKTIYSSPHAAISVSNLCECTALRSDLLEGLPEERSLPRSFWARHSSISRKPASTAFACKQVCRLHCQAGAFSPMGKRCAQARSRHLKANQSTFATCCLWSWRHLSTSNELRMSAPSARLSTISYSDSDSQFCQR